MIEFARSEGWIRTILTLTAYLFIGVGWVCVRAVEALKGRRSETIPDRILALRAERDELRRSFRDGIGTCEKCGTHTRVLYAPEYGANFCHPCAVNPRDLKPGQA